LPPFGTEPLGMQPLPELVDDRPRAEAVMTAAVKPSRWSTDKAIKWSTIVAVLVVAAVVASLSYLHALEVVGEHSKAMIMNNGFPLTVDGLIYAGSMVLLNDARRGLDAPRSHTGYPRSAPTKVGFSKSKEHTL
jgi:hypothetical protein